MPYLCKDVQRWKKLTKEQWQNSELGKLAHKICAKNAQNREKLTKYAKNCTKKGFFKHVKKPKLSTSVKN